MDANASGAGWDPITNAAQWGGLAKYWIGWSLNTGKLSIPWSDREMEEGIKYARRAWRAAMQAEKERNQP